MTGPPVPLRRADWRFLLPAPATGSYRHLVLLGGPPGLAERLREAGVAQQVSGRLPSARSADAVVVLHDAAVRPNAAARCVAEGGVFYCEVDRRQPAAWRRTPERVQRELREAGLAPLGVYWIVPGFDQARRYLPLDSAEALAWYFATLQTAGSPAAWLADAVIRAVSRGGWRRLSRWAPNFGVAAVAGATGGAPASVLGHAALPAAVRRPGVFPLMLTSGQDDGSRVVLLPFAPGRAEPVTVLKATRSPAFNGNTEREQRTLGEIRARLDAEMRATIPEPLGTYPYGDLVVGVESCASGPALVVSSGRWGAPLANAIDDLRLATEWLTRFHRQATCGTGRWGDGLSVRIAERVERYRQQFGSVGAEGRLLSLALERSRALADVTVPTVWLHNDYGPWNVHRSGSRLTVIDWELGGDGEREIDRAGPPLCDLLYFVTHWYYRVRHLRGDLAELQGFRALFLDATGPNPAADAARAAVHQYLAQLDLDPRLHPVLLAYTWVDRALDRADRGGVADSAVAPATNRYRDYVRVLAERADQLFAVADPS